MKRWEIRGLTSKRVRVFDPEEVTSRGAPETDPGSVGLQRDAVEAIWGVEVLKVNTLNRPGKRKRTRGTNRIGTRPDTKRAIVTLAAGEIPLFEN